MRLWGQEGQLKDGQDKDSFIGLVDQVGNQAPVQTFWKAPSTLPPASLATFSWGLFQVDTRPGLPLSSGVPK